MMMQNAPPSALTNGAPRGCPPARRARRRCAQTPPTRAARRESTRQRTRAHTHGSQRTHRHGQRLDVGRPRRVRRVLLPQQRCRQRCRRGERRRSVARCRVKKRFMRARTALRSPLRKLAQPAFVRQGGGCEREREFRRKRHRNGALAQRLLGKQATPRGLNSLVVLQLLGVCAEHGVNHLRGGRIRRRGRHARRGPSRSAKAHLVQLAAASLEPLHQRAVLRRGEGIVPR